MILINKIFPVIILFIAFIAKGQNVKCSSEINALGLDSAQKITISQNPQLKSSFETYGNCISKTQINSVLEHLESNKWTDYQSSVAINIYSKFNNKIKFTKDSVLINQVNHEIENYIDSMDERISYSINIPKSDYSKESQINKILRENKVLWETYMNNMDSIDYYTEKKEYQKLELFLKKLKTEEQ